MALNKAFFMTFINLYFHKESSLFSPIFYRCPSPTVYHDAPEYPPSRDQKCPNCSIVFGPRCTDEDLAKHIQSHFTWECPQCKVLIAKEDERIIKSHQERCQKNQEPPQQCPVCSEDCSKLTPGEFQEHVNHHFE